MFCRLFVVALMLMAPSSTFAQTKKKEQAPRQKPTVADYVYGEDSPRQKFDFWQAKSKKPTPVVVMIHGGAWQAGDKGVYRDDSIDPLLNAGISVASINYRFISQAMEQHVEPPVKASLLDAARALQTIRSKAKEWNIDPQRIGATGSSAGACTSLWLALHDDLANPKSEDPVARQSTRLMCAAVVGAQTSLDPIEVRKWISNAEYGGHAFGFKKEGRNRPEEFALLIENREKLLPWIKEYSPIEWVSKDDPPIYMSYPTQILPPVEGHDEKNPTHAAMYGVRLAEKLKSAGVEAVLTYKGKKDTKYGSVPQFLIAKLSAN